MGSIEITGCGKQFFERFFKRFYVNFTEQYPPIFKFWVQFEELVLKRLYICDYAQFFDTKNNGPRKKLSFDF